MLQQENIKYYDLIYLSIGKIIYMTVVKSPYETNGKMFYASKYTYKLN